MPHTVWSAGQLIGHTDLERTAAGPGARSGDFRPTPAFEAVWPVLRAANALGAQVAAGLATLPPSSTGEEIHAWLVAQPGADALKESRVAVAALALELRDPAGGAVPCLRILISEGFPPSMINQLGGLDAGAAQELARQVAEGWPGYIVTVVPEGGGRPRSAG